jgi:hypothetical protein
MVQKDAGRILVEGGQIVNAICPDNPIVSA